MGGLTGRRAGRPPASCHTVEVPRGTRRSLALALLTLSVTPTRAAPTRERPSTPLARFDAPTPTDRHFLIGNERCHEVLYEHIAGLGGSYVGVGSDQNYSLMAAARAQPRFGLNRQDLGAAFFL